MEKTCRVRGQLNYIIYFPFIGGDSNNVVLYLAIFMYGSSCNFLFLCLILAPFRSLFNCIPMAGWKAKKQIVK